MPITLQVKPPIAFAHFEGTQSESDLDAYMRQFDALMAKEQPYFVVSWMQSYSQSPALVARMGNWMKERTDAMRRLCVATSLVTTSPTFRFTLSAVFLIRPMACPYVVCEDFPKAVEFLREHSAKRRVPFPLLVESPWPGLPTRPGSSRPPG